MTKKTETKKSPSTPKIIVEVLTKKQLAELKRSLKSNDKKKDVGPKKIASCVACYGHIVEKTVQILPRRDFIGHQASYSRTTYHCNMCGITYEHPPKKEVRRRQAR